MRRELHYFDVYPKVVPVGQTVEITVKCQERKYKAPDGGIVNIKIIPMTEALEDEDTEKYTRREAISHQGLFSFTACFDREQEYALMVYVNDNDFIRLSVYALEADLYARVPLKGDFHVHSNYSDGWESPEAVVAYYRKAGYDFLVISDHGNYQGSVDAQSFYEGVSTGIHIVRGEEVHAPGNHVHIVNFGGEFSVNALFQNEPEQYEAEVRVLEERLDPSLIFSNPREKFEYASCLWIYQQIRKGNGLGIYAHPHWIIGPYQVRDSMTRLQFQQKCFDAFELVGGMSPKENNMQLALYHTACKNGYGDFPIVGSSDSHGVIREGFSGSTYESWGNNAYGFNEFFTLVFAASNDKDDIIAAVKDGFTAAVDHYRGETPQAYGDYRMVSYALFLLSEYFPLHDDLCYEEGRLMKQLTYEPGLDSEAARALASSAGRVERLTKKYFPSKP